MKSLIEYVNNLNEGAIKEIDDWAKEIKTLGGFANFINCFPKEWEKYKDEIIKRCGWEESDKDNIVCQEPNNEKACIYYNPSFRKYVSREF